MENSWKLFSRVSENQGRQINKSYPQNKRKPLLIIKMVPEFLQYRKALNLGVCKSELKTAQFWFDVSRQYQVVYDSLKQKGLCGSVIKLFFELVFQRLKVLIYRNQVTHKKHVFSIRVTQIGWFLPRPIMSWWRNVPATH